MFLRHGYLGATTDEVAARASVSKQTLYKHFADKQHLFAEVILDASVQVVDGLASAVASTLDDAQDVRQGLRALADGFLRGLLEPDVVRLRRLVIAEADRFPEIGRAWFDRGFDRALVILGEAMRRLADRGLLQGLDDPALAAYQFAGLVMYQPMNQVMFAGTEALPPPTSSTASRTPPSTCSSPPTGSDSEQPGVDAAAARGVGERGRWRSATPDHHLRGAAAHPAPETWLRRRRAGSARPPAARWGRPGAATRPPPASSAARAGAARRRAARTR